MCSVFRKVYVLRPEFPTLIVIFRTFILPRKVAIFSNFTKQRISFGQFRLQSWQHWHLRFVSASSTRSRGYYYWTSCSLIGKLKDFEGKDDLFSQLGDNKTPYFPLMCGVKLRTFMKKFSYWKNGTYLVCNSWMLVRFCHYDEFEQKKAKYLELRPKVQGAAVANEVPHKCGQCVERLNTWTC